MESAASALPCGCSPRRPVLKVHPRRGMHQNLTSTCAYGPHLVFPFIWKTGWFLPSETGLYDSSVSIKCLLCARHDASRKKRFIFLFFFFFWITRGSPALRFLRGFLVAVSVGRLSGRVVERPPWRPGLRAPSHGALGEILSSGLRHVFVRNSTDDRMVSSSLAVG